MDRFEQAFSDTETAADSTLKSATDLARLARQMQKAAKDGNINAIKRTRDRFDAALADLGRSVDAAIQSWPFEDEQEEQYLRDGYAAELRRLAAERGLKIEERDGRLISHPSIVRILPRDRAVRIDRKRVSTIRPSHLIGILLDNQNRSSRHQTVRFLQALYTVYSELAREDTGDRLMRSVAGRVVPLDRIYRMLTSLPGSDREYSRTDFGRDLYLLDTSGLKETRSGASVSFSASTGTRGSRGVFTFVGPDGVEVQYYGVRFAEAD